MILRRSYLRQCQINRPVALQVTSWPGATRPVNGVVRLVHQPKRMGSDGAGALSLDSLGKLFDIKYGENVSPTYIALSREGAGMRPEFRQPVDGRRHVAKDEARLTFGQGRGSFEAEGPRDDPLMSLVEDEARAYWAGLLTDTGCHDVREVAERIHQPKFRRKLSGLLRAKEDKGPGRIVRAIVQEVYAAYEWFKSHVRGWAELHWNGGSARFIPSEGNREVSAPLATLEESAGGDVSLVVQEEGRVAGAGIEHDWRKKKEWERRQAKKTRPLEARKTRILDEAMQSPIEVEVPAPELTEQAPLFEPDETPTYQDIPAVQERWTGRVAPRKRRRNLKRTVGPEPLPLPSKPPSRAS